MCVWSSKTHQSCRQRLTAPRSLCLGKGPSTWRNPTALRPPSVEGGGRAANALRPYRRSYAAVVAVSGAGVCESRLCRCAHLLASVRFATSSLR